MCLILMKFNSLDYDPVQTTRIWSVAILCLNLRSATENDTHSKKDSQSFRESCFSFSHERGTRKLRPLRRIEL